MLGSCLRGCCKASNRKRTAVEALGRGDELVGILLKLTRVLGRAKMHEHRCGNTSHENDVPGELPNDVMRTAPVVGGWGLSRVHADDVLKQVGVRVGAGNPLHVLASMPIEDVGLASDQANSLRYKQFEVVRRELRNRIYSSVTWVRIPRSSAMRDVQRRR